MIHNRALAGFNLPKKSQIKTTGFLPVSLPGFLFLEKMLSSLAIRRGESEQVYLDSKGRFRIKLTVCAIKSDKHLRDAIMSDRFMPKTGVFVNLFCAA